MPKFKITTWRKHERIITASCLEEAVAMANKDVARWESVQYLSVEDARAQQADEVVRKTEAVQL